MKTIIRKLLATALSICVALSPWRMALSAQSDAPNDDAASEAQLAGKPFGGFGPNLAPTARTPGTTPYEPIQPDADNSRIPEIDMFVGESRVFPTPGVVRIAVGNGRVLTAAALDKKAVIIFANSVGVSSLFVWSADGRYERVKINVVPGDTTRIAREIAAFLKSIPGAEASVIGDKVVIQGDRLSARDLQKIKILGERYKDNIINFTDPMGWEKMVLLDVKLVEFPRKLLKNTGIQWTAMGGGAVAGIWGPFHRVTNGAYQINIQTGSNNPAPITDASGTGSVTVPSGLNILSLLNLGLNAQINLLQQNGDAAILAEPQLSAKNGSEANFFAGGEIPYSVSNLTGTTVQFKKYGIKLEIKPRVNQQSDIDTEIFVEDSSIDSSIATDAGPALLTRQMKTEFNVRNGQTIILSGLLSRSSSTDIQKVPLLGDIPILGALFRSKNFQDQQTELVVFVTPTVVTPEAPGLVDRITKTKARLEQQMGPDPFLIDPLQPGHDQSHPEVGQNVRAIPATPPALIGQPVAPASAASLPAPTAATSADSYRTVPVGQNPLSTEATQSSASGAVLQVLPYGTPLRSRPGVGTPVVMQLPTGAVVRLGDAMPPASFSGWCNVVVGRVTGWVQCSMVRPVATNPVISPNLNRQTRLDRQGTPLNNHADQRIAADAPQVITATGNTTQPGKPYRVLLDHLALRVSPDINANVTRHLSQGSLVHLLAQPPVGPWVPVRAGDATGWVASQWLLPEH